MKLTLLVLSLCLLVSVAHAATATATVGACIVSAGTNHPATPTNDPATPTHSLTLDTAPNSAGEPVPCIYVNYD